MNGYKRIAIIGNSGAGKSTLARSLTAKLDLPLYVVDKIYWMPGWSLRDQSSYKELHDQWLVQDQWLIDGVGYWEELESRITISDLVIFYDVPASICKDRALQRIESEKLEPNKDIVEGCRYSDVVELQMSAIDNFEKEFRSKIIKALESLESSKVKVIGREKELNIEFGI